MAAQHHSRADDDHPAQHGIEHVANDVDDGRADYDDDHGANHYDNHCAIDVQHDHRWSNHFDDHSANHDNDDRSDDDHHDGPHNNNDGIRAAGRVIEVLTSQQRPRPDRRKRQRGAVLIETALTAPLLFLMIFGLVELSFMLKDHLTIRAVTQDAARTATVAGDDIDADFRILATAVESGSTLPEGSITRIVVYRADTADSPVPPACLLSGQSTASVNCNSYVPFDFSRPESDFACDPMLAIDRFWCPADRVVVRAPANGGPPDYVGIHVVLQRELLTGMFGSTQTLEATYVLRLEPRNL